ncbi:Lsr2 family protein [Streptomyces sp. NPDC101151]|uniref:histone-like nucleoid-structuring protein Lsr2 n=1 Tax=Streptomyces sp. NPDC101151 TaxID=3366115 RepID=UPI003825ACC4
MAQRIVTVYTDDLTGEQGADVALHTFSLDGIAYEIDLGIESHQKLLDALSPFLRAGRKTKAGRRRSPSRPAPASNETDTMKVREWARSKGLRINDRGRVPGDILKEYQAAH